TDYRHQYIRDCSLGCGPEELDRKCDPCPVLHLLLIARRESHDHKQDSLEREAERDLGERTSNQPRQYQCGRYDYQLGCRGRSISACGACTSRCANQSHGTNRPSCEVADWRAAMFCRRTASGCHHSSRGSAARSRVVSSKQATVESLDWTYCLGGVRGDGNGLYGKDPWRRLDSQGLWPCCGRTAAEQTMGYCEYSGGSTES